MALQHSFLLIFWLLLAIVCLSYPQAVVSMAISEKEGLN